LSCGSGTVCEDIKCYSYPMIELRLSDYSRQEPPTGIAYASVRVASPSATARNMSSAPVSDDTLLPPEFRIAAFSAPGVEVAPIGISHLETDKLLLEVTPPPPPARVFPRRQRRLHALPRLLHPPMASRLSRVRRAR
jgi:hypothetical protein